MRMLSSPEFSGRESYWEATKASIQLRFPSVSKPDFMLRNRWDYHSWKAEGVTIVIWPYTSLLFDSSTLHLISADVLICFLHRWNKNTLSELNSRERERERELYSFKLSPTPLDYLFATCVVNPVLLVLTILGNGDVLIGSVNQHSVREI